MFCDGCLTPHHIGYAVTNIEDSKKTFGFLGFCVINEQYNDFERNVNIQFMKNKGLMIELIAVADTRRHSEIDFLMKKGNGKSGVTPYHTCFEVERFEETIAKQREKRFVLLSHPAPAPALGGKRVAFLYHKNTGLIELLERERLDTRPK